MRKLLFILLIGFSCLLQAQTTKERPDNKQVKVTNVGNAGFLIHIGDKKIIRQNYPYAIIFKEELQSWRMADTKQVR